VTSMAEVAPTNATEVWRYSDVCGGGAAGVTSSCMISFDRQSISTRFSIGCSIAEDPAGAADSESSSARESTHQVHC
jgi:hypothetical protein